MKKISLPSATEDTPMKKLLFADIDGTLLRRGEVSEADIEAVKKFRAEGNALILCSGRTPSSVARFLDLFPKLPCDGAVAAGGGGLYLTQGRSPALLEPLEQMFINSQSSLELLDYIYRQEPRFSIHWSDGSGRFGFADRHVHRNTSPDPEFITLGDWVKRGLPMLITVLSSLDEVPEEALRVQKDILLRWGDVLEAHVNGIYVDISAKGADKGRGIRSMAELRAVPISRCYALGDGFNDIPMFEAVGKANSFLIQGGERSLIGRVRQAVDDAAGCIAAIMNGSK